MDNKIEEYKAKLRENAHYQSAYNEIISDYRNLVAQDPESAKDFAVRMLSEKSKMKNLFNNNAENIGTRTEYDVKIQVDCEALAILDIDFTAILKMEREQSATFQINNIKAMLKNKKEILSPAQTTLNQFVDIPNESTMEDNEFENQDSRVVFRVTPKFLDLDREEKAKRIKKYIIKDISDELYRLNFKLIEKINANTNKLYNADANINEIEKKRQYKTLQELIARKRALSGLLAIFGGLANSQVKDNANDILISLINTAKLVDAKYNSNPTIEEIDALQAQKMLVEIEKISNLAIEAQEKHESDFAEAKGVVSFMNIWYDNFNNGEILDRINQNFGDSVNTYVGVNAKKIGDYARAYIKGDKENIASQMNF